MAIYYETERYVADRRQAGAEEPGIRLPRPRRQRAPPRPHQLPREGCRGQRRVHRRGARRSRDASASALDDGGYAAWWFHFNNKSYDIVYSDDWTKHGDRLHHIAFAPDTREDILKAADIFLENGIHIESGPHKHAINQTFFLYVWEPGGNRIEFANAGARLLLDPDSAGRGVDRGGAQEGSGVGHEDDRDVPHPRHAQRQVLSAKCSAESRWRPGGSDSAGHHRRSGVMME